MVGTTAMDPQDRGAPDEIVDRTIVVVEDEFSLRDLFSRSLVGAGYRVIAFRDGEEAMRGIRRVRDVALVVADIMMPKVTGVEMVRQLRAERPGLPVLFVSAIVSDLPEDLADAELLQKPFTHRELLAAVTRAIASHG
jgi:two-component system cell cycle sensor histidine kinase/response regulator CckA